MTTLAIALMIVSAVAIVAYPLFHLPPATEMAFVRRTDPALDNLIAQRDAAYTAIKDVESDYGLGKLSEADYRALRSKYEAHAVTILQELDRLTATRGSGVARDEDRIEREVEQLRRAGRTALVCPKCGTRHAPADVFCAKCGASLRGTRCPACGKRAAAGSKLCSRCGKPL